VGDLDVFEKGPVGVCSVSHRIWFKTHLLIIAHSFIVGYSFETPAPARHVLHPSRSSRMIVLSRHACLKRRSTCSPLHSFLGTQTSPFDSRSFYHRCHDCCRCALLQRSVCKTWNVSTPELRVDDVEHAAVTPNRFPS